MLEPIYLMGRLGPTTQHGAYLSGRIDVLERDLKRATDLAVRACNLSNRANARACEAQRDTSDAIDVGSQRIAELRAEATIATNAYVQARTERDNAKAELAEAHGRLIFAEEDARECAQERDKAKAERSAAQLAARNYSIERDSARRERDGLVAELDRVNAQADTWAARCAQAATDRDAAIRERDTARRGARTSVETIVRMGREHADELSRLEAQRRPLGARFAGSVAGPNGALRPGGLITRSGRGLGRRIDVAITSDTSGIERAVEGQPPGYLARAIAHTLTGQH